MNSNRKPSSNNNLNNFNFDFDLGSNFNSTTNRSHQPLKQQPQPSSSSFSSYSQPKPSPTSTWAPNKPSWTHQPAPSQSVRSELLNPTSMVGDIHGKSWTSKTPSPSSSSSSSSGIGIVEKNPNLFSDLLGSALGGQSKSNANVPLKNAASVLSGASAKSSSPYSMGNLANSLPKTGATGGQPLNSAGIGNSWGSGENLGNLGGPSMKSGGGLGTTAAKKDLFGSFVDFGSKKEPSVKVNASSNTSSSSVKNSDDSLFGDFQNAGKSSTKKDNFGAFDIPVQDFSSQKQPAPQSTGVNPLDALFSSSSGGQVRGDGTGSELFSEMNDWDMGEEFGGGDVGNTTELEGLPPPPAGVTASSAKNKGMDSYKQGQHADGIKWLSWAVVLLEKAGDSVTTKEVLSCRASCYKEVGEYKKAIADCTKVLEQDDANVSVLIQRALLYESTEKYKLGAEDLRTVMKIDPGNRLARSTIHRLLQLAD